jgi:hypothetical protein
MYNKKKLRDVFKFLNTVFIFIFIFSLLITPVFVLAQPVTGGSGGNPVTGTGGTGAANCKPGQLCNPLKWETLIEFWREILKIAAQIGSIFVVIGFVYTGFLFVRAQGNAEELQVAKRSFTYTVIGAALVLGAWAFAMAIAETVASITAK